jgi:proline dehydrogenase
MMMLCNKACIHFVYICAALTVDLYMSDLSFENTEIAFSYKSNKDLNRAYFLFLLMSNSTLVKIATRITPWAINMGLPVTSLIRATIFKQFCGGETLEETEKMIATLANYHCGVILDYGVEGKESNEEFDKATEAFVHAIEFAGRHQSIPFVSVKVTGLTSFALLEKVNQKEILSDEEQQAWQATENRLITICEAAQKNGVSLMIDAEESWIQDAIDALCEKMMIRYNKQRAVVINTIQLYRHDRLAFLQNAYTRLKQHSIIQGYKLVRGAYMEKERKRAEELHYTSPIQPNKESSDRDYNAAIDFCLQHIDDTLLCVASHNEYSNRYAAEKAVQLGIAKDHKHLHFSQLFGMSDNITFNLAKAGYRVTKYLPYGPVKDVVPYLMRRAQENTSVAGQTGRELSLVRKERARRKMNTR